MNTDAEDIQSAQSMLDQASSKRALRRSLLKMRQAMPAESWRIKSHQMGVHLQRSPWFATANTILAYACFRQEPDLSSLFKLHSRWGLPRCVDQSLVWHLWRPDQDPPLQPGAYGISTPAADALILHPAEVDLVLVPAVACDAQGYRLGYGGGFYDRLFSDPAWTNIPTIGMVFEFARLPQLPVEPWDCPLQAVCTEAGLFTVGD